MTRDLLVAYLRIEAVLRSVNLMTFEGKIVAHSTISNMNVLLSLNRSSLAPTRLKTLSTIPIVAASAGTKLPAWARMAITAV